MCKNGSGRMARVALALSIAVILAYWVYSVRSSLLRSGEAAVPTSVGAIALYVCLKTVAVVGVIWLCLRAGGERLADLGCGPWTWGPALLHGVPLGVGQFLIFNVLVASLLASFGAGAGTSPAVRALFRDPREAPLWVFCAVVGGGFTEELVRAFILTRFERAFGRIGLVFAVVVDAIEFGMGHRYQGVGSAVQCGVGAVYLALVFLRRRRVADAMAAHATFDLLGVAGAYALYAGGA